MSAVALSTATGVFDMRIPRLGQQASSDHICTEHTPSTTCIHIDIVVACSIVTDVLDGSWQFLNKWFIERPSHLIASDLYGDLGRSLTLVDALDLKIATTLEYSPF